MTVSRWMFETEEEYREAMAAQRAMIEEMDAEIAPYLEALRAERQKLTSMGRQLTEFRDWKISRERAEVKRQIKGKPTLYHVLDTETTGNINGLYTYYSSSGIELLGVEIYWRFTPPYVNSFEVNEWLRGMGLKGYSEMGWGDSVYCGIHAYTFEDMRIITDPEKLGFHIPDSVTGRFPKGYGTHYWTKNYKRLAVSPHQVTAVKREEAS